MFLCHDEDCIEKSYQMSTTKLLPAPCLGIDLKKYSAFFTWRTTIIAKIRPLVSLLNAKWLAHFPKENFLAVDEAMVPYYGRNGLKQHIHGKPIRFGYKVWCLCTRTGYLVQALPYHRSTTGYSNPEFGMGGSVVLDLISELPSEVEYRLFFDNLFTSIPLLDHLKQSNIGATGTIRVNRTGKTPLLHPSCMKKKACGTYCSAKEKDSG